MRRYYGDSAHTKYLLDIHLKWLDKQTTTTTKALLWKDKLQVAVERGEVNKEANILFLKKNKKGKERKFPYRFSR